MIEQCIENWHRAIRGELPGGLDEVLADDVVFYSPIVFTPQLGKDVAKLYLTAAGLTIGGGAEKSEGADAPVPANSPFKYTKQVLSGHQAVLEFETEMEGKYVNGVDIIVCNDEGRIVEFRVMIRPLQAVNLVHAQMMAMLEKLGDG